MNKIKSYFFLFLFLFSCNTQDEITRAHIDTYTKLFSISKDNILEIENIFKKSVSVAKNALSRANKKKN